METLVKNILPYGLLLLTFCGISDALPVHFPLIIIWGITALTIIVFYYARHYFPQNNMALINLYTAWNIICIIRGCFTAEIYWDWKNLIGTGFGMLMPVFCYAFAYPRCDSILLKNLIKYVPILFVLLLFSTATDRPGRLLTFFYLFMVCFTAIPPKWKVLTFIVVLFSVFYDLDARSNAIRAIIALLIGFLYYIRTYIFRYLQIIQRYAFYIPFLLFCLAALGIFNIFKIDNYFGDYTIQKVDNGKTRDINLSADTRTFLYEEVLMSSIKNGHILLGRTPARGYESHYFTFNLAEQRALGIRQGERHGTEVSILNIYLHSGLIGVVLYFLIFYQATYLAIFKSRNTYIKLIGLFVIFRWCYGWIEDFNQFDINYAMLWMFIAMCYSVHFRQMTDKRFKVWLLSIIRK